jgi:hypothetical protein
MQISLFSLFAGNPEIIYTSPKAGSGLNYIDSKIILKFSEHIEKFDINLAAINVIGEKSGIHHGEIIIAEDGRTMIFKPYQRFLTNEFVQVTISGDLFTNHSIRTQSFSFTTANSDRAFQPHLQRIENDVEFDKPFFNTVKDSDSFLEELPEVTFTINDTNKAYKGYTLLNAYQAQGDRNYLMILDYKGELYKWRKTSPSPFNFKLQANGQYAYTEADTNVANQSIVRILDEDLNLVASYSCGNGYSTATHDVILLPNGNIILVASDPMPFNMRDIVPNGDPNANVIGSVVQELDKDMNVVFQWRSGDHTDVDETYENISLNSFRTLHINAIEVDTDGNFLFSARNFSQIIKVNRNTGEIMWRLGGKKNEFEFIGEHEENAPFYFSQQHDIRRQSNGNITLFDNGNLRPTPQYSRVVEYNLDEINKTATLVWDYRHTPDIYVPLRGSAQVLPNGNILVGNGGSSATVQTPSFEVDPSTKEIVMAYNLPLGFSSYRTFKIDLPACQATASVMLEELLEGNTYNFNNHQNNTGIEVEFKKLVTPIPYNSLTVIKYNCSPMNPEFEGTPPMLLINRIEFTKAIMSEYNGEVTLDLTNYANNIKLNAPKAFHRSTVGEGIFSELPTTFDAISNTIKFTIYDDGEICIGDYFDIAVPQMTRLVTPRNNSILNSNKDVKFVWSPNGRYNSNKLLIYKNTNDEFELIKEIEDIRLTSFEQDNSLFQNDAEYNWQVISSNDFGEGEPSEMNNFIVKDSYINMLSPNGGEKLIRDSISYVIKWDDNLDDQVRIELLDGAEIVLKIADSLQSPLNNIRWTIPASVPTGDNYKIRVTSVGDDAFSTISVETFEIIDKATSVDNNYLIQLFALSISPNPVSDILNISMKSELAEVIEVSLSDINGIELILQKHRIVQGINQFHLNISDLTSSAYMIRFNTSKGTLTQKILKIK